MFLHHGTVETDMYDYDAKFSLRTAIEQILYICARVEKPDLRRVFKIMYFADRHHLENYRRTISGDTYAALEQGPVPSHTYDFVKQVRDNPSFLLARKSDVPAFSVVNVFMFRANRDFDPEEFSASEREALDWALEKYGSMPDKQLLDHAHDATWKATSKGRISLENLTLGMPGREHLIEYYHNPQPGVAGHGD